MIEQALSSLGIDYKLSKKGWANISCPLSPWTHEKKGDRRPSCGIHLETTRYYCFGCGANGYFHDLAKEVGTKTNNPLWLTWADDAEDSSQYLLGLLNAKERSTQEVVLPEIHLDSINHWKPVSKSHTATWYFEKRRKIPIENCQRYDVRYDAANDRVVFPIRVSSEHFVGAVGRSVHDKPYLPYYNYFDVETGEVLGGEFELDNPRAIGFVEGFIDVLNAWPVALNHGIQLVCTFSKNFSDTHASRLLKYDVPLFSFYDQDKAGRSGENKAKSKLKHLTYLYNTVKWDTDKDLGEMAEDELNFLFEGLL
jgi:hypothetical protein